MGAFCARTYLEYAVHVSEFWFFYGVNGYFLRSGGIAFVVGLCTHGTTGLAGVAAASQVGMHAEYLAHTPAMSESCL